MFCQFSALNSESGQRTRCTHLAGGIELGKWVQYTSKEFESYKMRGLYNINEIHYENIHKTYVDSKYFLYAS